MKDQSETRSNTVEADCIAHTGSAGGNPVVTSALAPDADHAQESPDINELLNGNLLISLTVSFTFNTTRI